MKLSQPVRRAFTFASLPVLAAAVGACDGYDHPLPPAPGVVTQDVPPPAISGGTLLVTDSGLAVAADADRDRVYIVDLDAEALRATVQLDEGDEPGRVVADAAGRLHVALRGAGALLDLDAQGNVLGRREVCQAPRGLAFDSASDALHVACAGGELVTFPAAGGDATRRLRFDPDLRDVVMDGDNLVLSFFRAATLVVLDADGKPVRSREPARFLPASGASGQEFEPTVAWRTIAMPGGGVIMSHQRSMTSTIVLAAPAYYSASLCDPSIVHGAVTVMRNVAQPTATVPLAAATIPFAPLPVDVAVSRDGAKIAIASAGSDQVITIGTGDTEDEAGQTDCSNAAVPQPVDGQPVAVAFSMEGKLVVQLREPGRLLVDGKAIELAEESRWDSGHDLFHRSPNINMPTSVACASCHPEGREDGHTWAFDIGPRRTQGIGGGVLKTTPLHWDGDLEDFDAMMDEVFVRRMSGNKPGARKAEAFASWINALPVVPTSPPVDEAAVERGRVLFESEAVGCASCHAGERLTNDKNEDVGTGRAFQVPTLRGVALRGPFMHDGCAKTLADRFAPGACGGGDKHGQTSHLDAGEIDDLVAYLETL
jgi:DNA-binding beta-propeller fold protein YncE